MGRGEPGRRALLAVVVAAVAGAGVFFFFVPRSDVEGPGEGEVAGSRFEALLGLMPDNAATRQGVSMVDFERGRTGLGVSFPRLAEYDAALAEYLTTLSQQSRATGALPPLGQAFIAGARGEVIRPSSVGYGLDDVEGEITAGVPPSTYEAIIGRFDPAASRIAISNCSGCPQAEIESYRGVEYYAWGEDFEQDLRARLQPPAFDELGRGGRLVFAESYVLRALWTAGIEEMIAVQESGSLADNRYSRSTLLR